MSQTQAPQPPVLVSPTDGRIFPPGDVLFEWASAGEGLQYELQIATDVAFTQVLSTLDAGTSLDVVVTDLFEDAEPGATYYWRARAQAPGSDAWGPYSEPTHFILGTEENIPIARPDPKEDLGPLPHLVKDVSEDVAEVYGLTSPPKEGEAFVEPEAMSVSPILTFIGSTVLFLAVAIILVFGIANRVEQATYYRAVSASGYPELREVEALAARKLDHYEILNDAEGTYRIPIERAMEIIVAQEAADTTARVFSSELP